MKIEPKNNCPLNKFEPCKQLDCAWFMEVNGLHPQTGEPIKEWGCSMAWLPILMINSAKEQHSTASAVESFRNEMVKSNEVGQQVLLATLQQQPRVNPNPMILENE